MANLKVAVSDFGEYRGPADDKARVVALPDCFDGMKLVGGGKFDAVEFEYDGGRLSVYVNGVEVVNTYVSESVNVKVELTNERVSQDAEDEDAEDEEYGRN